MNEMIITNARLVTPSEVLRGSLYKVDGVIAADASTPSPHPAAPDLQGDFLIPGLVEIHTDNLEKHLMPRPQVFWPYPLEAVLAHDSQICCAGITTVLDAVFLGAYHSVPQRLHASRNRSKVTETCLQLGITLASHDDTSEAGVLQAVDEGVSLSEFPTTLEAAHKAHACGLKVVAGAPNLVRGSSHSGNVSAMQLAREGFLDILSSDYVPSGLLSAAFVLHHHLGFGLPDAIARVSANPAAMIGLEDRAQIVAGGRADLLRVSVCDNLPVVRTVWREGQRVC